MSPWQCPSRVKLGRNQCEQMFSGITRKRLPEDRHVMSQKCHYRKSPVTVTLRLTLALMPRCLDVGHHFSLRYIQSKRSGPTSVAPLRSKKRVAGGAQAKPPMTIGGLHRGANVGSVASDDRRRAETVIDAEFDHMDGLVDLDIPADVYALRSPLISDGSISDALTSYQRDTLVS